MEYVWLIMLVIIDALWIIATIYDIIRAVNEVKNWHCISLFDLIDSFLFNIDGWAKGCVVVHVLFLFIYSLLLFLKEV